DEIEDWDINLQAQSTNRPDAIQAARENYDVIIIDYLLGEETGLDVLKRLQMQGCRAPFLMLTGQGSEMVAVEAMKSGVSDYIVKDRLDSELLRHTLRHILEKEEMRRKIQEQQELLTRMAITDELTGLFNRRYFFESLKKETERAERYQLPLSVLMFDLDHFKKVNDRYGHLVGDRVLAASAKIIQLQLRSSDVAARYGGEEFCLLLVNTPCEGARIMAERIRKAIQSHEFKDEEGGVFQITCSIGVAEFRHPLPDLDALMSLADQALYESKTKGRNRVTIHPTSMCA
ncbi:diguanylate cyclase, partial [bacterium]|nr:diguanylate cyclase [bacterium]